MRVALILNKRKDLEFSHEFRLAHASHAETPPVSARCCFRISLQGLRRHSTGCAVSSEASSGSPGPDLRGIL
jgi:hypothetical protein